MKSHASKAAAAVGLHVARSFCAAGAEFLPFPLSQARRGTRRHVARFGGRLLLIINSSLQSQNLDLQGWGTGPAILSNETKSWFPFAGSAQGNETRHIQLLENMPGRD